MPATPLHPLTRHRAERFISGIDIADQRDDDACRDRRAKELAFQGRRG
jgi:hypothetical protein